MLHPLCVSHPWCCLQSGEASANKPGASAIQPGETCRSSLSLLPICRPSLMCAQAEASKRSALQTRCSWQGPCLW